MSPEKEQALRDKISRLEHQVSILAEKAKQSDSDSQAKSDFLAMISHEIRTPMNGVMGLCELLLETELNPRQNQFAKLIQSSAQNLLTLLNSLLDFSKIEAEKMTIEMKEFDLKELLEEVVEVHKLSGKRKGLEVGLVLDPRLCKFYQGDAYRIRQVLINLLGNAIKFTDEGMVLLNVAIDDMAKEWLRFTVVDNGIGIPKDKQATLFDPFSQVESPSDRQYSGTGLGLSICKKLIELMGGTLGVESEEGEGSSFWFTLRLVGSSCDRQTLVENANSAGQPLPSGHAADVMQPARVLLVDDNEVNRMVLEETFRKTNADITVAENGRQAVEFCQHQFFDLILMDCRMPVMDGFEATVQIRKQFKEKNLSGTVIIALTADATSTAENRCQAVGMDGFLLKPLNTSELQRALDVHLQSFKLDVSQRMYYPSTMRESPTKNPETVDLGALDKLCENIGDIKPVVIIFLRLLPRRMNELETAVKNLDSKGIESLAHTLKGSCSQFGATELANLCAEAESMARENRLTSMQEHFIKIQRSAEQVRKILEEQLE
ncbi:MAG: hypothetical protein DSY50_06205 [Desulfobulbus sp.]|nr:MAG: hypothetical protein DSY50_06205 [Desulfobulbus sp.]